MVHMAYEYNGLYGNEFRSFLIIMMYLSKSLLLVPTVMMGQYADAMGQYADGMGQYADEMDSDSYTSLIHR